MPLSSKKYIGELPRGWRQERLNNVAELYGRIGWQGLTSNEYQDEGPWLVTGTDFQGGVINWDSCVRISDKRWEEAYQIKLKPGDLLITKDGTVGKLAIVENQPGKASLNSGVMRIVPKDGKLYATRFLYYVLQTDVFKEWFKDINAGASTIQHLFQKDFKHFVFPMPSMQEQERIVTALNAECLEIDSILDTLSKQVDALERYRTSVIYEAVTKGLNPDVPMKPSGIDWIGGIPEGWSINKIKNVSALRTGRTPDSAEQERYYNGDIDWFTPADLNDAIAYSAQKQIKHVSISDGQAFIVPKNSTLLVGIGATAGKTGYLVVNASTNQQITAVIPNSQIEAKLLFYIMRAMRKMLRDLALYTTLPILNNQYIGNQIVPLPPYNEQVEIAHYLDTRTAAIDSIFETKRKQIDVLKRRRQSLIYEYVTGKRRVGKEI